MPGEIPSALSSIIQQFWPMVWPDAKLIASAAATMLGTIATLRQNVSALTERKTLRSRKQKEEAHLADLLDLRRKLEGLDSNQYATLRHQVDSEAYEASERLACLITKELELSRDPSYKLSLADRLFLLFRPKGLRAGVVQSVAYIFMFALPLLLIVWSSRHPLKDNVEMYADLIVLTTFAGLGFRAWALAERRWAAGLETKPRAVTNLLLLNRPINNEMRVAQFFLWVCLFSAVESLEDVFFRLANSEGTLFGPAVRLSLFLLGATICRVWGGAELKQAGFAGGQRGWGFIFPWQRTAPAKVWLGRIVYIAALVVPLLALLQGDQSFTNRASTEGFFSDALDRAQLLFLWVASSVAANRWLNLLSRQAPKVVSRSAAA